VAYLLLAAAQAVGLLLIPFSGLGLWLQLLALGIFAWRTGLQPVGVLPLAIIVGLGVAAELIRLATGAFHIPGPTRRRLGISGVAGGFVGAAAGVAVPLLGSMFGAIIGSGVATMIGTGTMRPDAERRSAVAASALAMALTTATGVVIAVFTLLIALR
jgi:hypothetical protein